MASGPQTFTIVGVFSAEHFRGNRLAIVSVRGDVLNKRQKRLIAREFGYPATAFLYDAVGPGLPRRVDIIPERGDEVPFSGHSVLGVTHYIFNHCEPTKPSNGDVPLTTILMTKAGPVPVLYNSLRQVSACHVPHNFHVHGKKIPFERVIDVQPQIQIVPTVERCKGLAFPVVSLVSGMSFALVDLTEAPEVLGAITAGNTPEIVLDEGRTSDYKGTLFYTKNEPISQNGEPTIHSIQARMIIRGNENPGAGTACCTLASYLALNPDIERDSAKSETDEALETTAKVGVDSRTVSTQRHVYAIQQGVEVARSCTLAVEIEVGTNVTGAKHLKRVVLSGKSCLFAKGELLSI